jgi:hypothetical protein
LLADLKSARMEPFKREMPAMDLMNQMEPKGRGHAMLTTSGNVMSNSYRATDVVKR